MLIKFAILACALLLCTCSLEDRPLAVKFHEPPYPERLSAWQLFDYDKQLQLAEDTLSYDLNTPLFTDYAHKLRTLHVPAGQTAKYTPHETFEFPVGTVVSKTFFYFQAAKKDAIRIRSTWSGHLKDINRGQAHLIETRLLAKQAKGWDALGYIWSGGDAYLAISGDLLTLDTEDAPLNYLVPSHNQCASCHATNHTTGEIIPIGLKARHLNRTSPHTDTNQLKLLSDLGWLGGLPSRDIPRAITLDIRDSPTDMAATDLVKAARAYLDINCGHCHNPDGPADTSGLHLDAGAHDLAAMGVCKPPIAAGRGAGGRLYSIVPGKADDSILTFRMAITDPGAMMPELGRSLVHEEGLALINAWVNSLTGACL